MQGLKPRAFYLKIWLEDEVAYLGECPWEEDWAFAEAVCKQAGVPLEAVPLQKEYWDKVRACQAIGERKKDVTISRVMWGAERARRAGRG